MHKHTHILSFIYIKLYIPQMLVIIHLILNFIITLYRGYMTCPNSHLITVKARTSSEVSGCLAKSSFHSNSCQQLLGRPEEETNLASLKLGMMGSDYIYKLVTIVTNISIISRLKSANLPFFKVYSLLKTPICPIHSYVQYQK